MNKKGFTLAGVILMGLLIAMMTVAGMDFYRTIQQQRVFVTNRFAAINLANAQIEDLMAMLYADPLLTPTGATAHATTFATLPAGFGVTYTVGPVQVLNITHDLIQYPTTFKVITVSVTNPNGIVTQIQGLKTS
jgi:hypothetical protein